MKLKSFTYNPKKDYSSLNLYDYIVNNYSYYNKKKVEKTCQILLNNLINRKKYVCISLNPNDYIGSDIPITYLSVKNALTILQDLNMIEIEIGYRDYTGKDKLLNEWIWDKKNAKLTTLHLKPYEEWYIDKLNISWLTLTETIICNNHNPKTNIVNRVKEKVIVDGKKKKINHDTPNNDSVLNNELNFINEFLKKKNKPNFQYHRVFGIDDFSSGRLVNSFQRVPKGLRQKVYDEQNWKEIDFKSCVVNTLYLIETGKLYEGDIYNDILEQARLPKEFRPLIKDILILALNTKSKEAAIKSIRKKLVEKGIYSKNLDVNYKKFSNTFVSYNFQYSFKKYKVLYPDLNYYLFTPDFILYFIEDNPILNKYLYSSAHSFTQYIESNVIIKVINKMISNNIIPITIHDCIIVPNNNLFDYESYMYDLLRKECFFYINNFVPILYSKTQKEFKVIYYIFALFSFYKIFPFKKNTISFRKDQFEYG